jgi:hypothetical protein
MPPSHEQLLTALSLELRRELEGPLGERAQRTAGDLERRLATLGIEKGRAGIAEPDLPPLTSEDRAAKAMAEAFLAERAARGAERDAAITALIGEAAFAWAFHLLTLRCSEARGLDPARPAPLDPPSALLALQPSPGARLRCLALLSGEERLKGLDPASDATFQGSDALGWAYQAWNSEEKRRLFEAMRVKKLAKLGGADIIPATCIYTRAHLVKLLVQSSLGACFRRSYPASRLPERWAFQVVGADAPPGPRRPVAALRFLDPACGSGHFLLEAFDLFFEMYRDEGLLTAPEAICASIFAHNLQGIDIDERAVQVAAISLRMRARERAPGFEPARMNLVATCIDAPAARVELARFLDDHPEHAPQRPALAALFGALDQAGELGALMRVEPVDQDDPARPSPLVEALTCFAEELDRRADEGRAPPSIEAARRALALIEILGRHHDVVCMNPPYVGFRKLAPHLKERVAEDALATLDLYVAFLSRFFSLLREGGCLAAVTPSSWTTSSKTAALRRKMLDEGGPSLVVSLGQRVFDTAPLLFVSLSVVHRGHHPGGGALITLRASTGSGEEGLLRAVQRADKRWPHALLRSLETLPFFPVAPLPLLERAREQPAVQDFFSFVDGLWTGNNDRDFREAWEVRPDDPRWVPTSGGQGYARWYAPFARRMRARDGRLWPAFAARAFSLEYSRVAGGKLAARVVRSPSLAIAGTVSLLPKAGADPRRLFETAAVFNSRLGTIWLRTLTSGLNFNPGYAGRIPLASAPPSPALEEAVLDVVARKRALARRDLTCDDFDPSCFAAGASPSLAGWAAQSVERALDESARVLEAEARIEELLRAHFEIAEDAWADLEAELGKPAAALPDGPFPASEEPITTEGEALDDSEIADDTEEARTLPAETALEALARAHAQSPRSLLSSNDLPAPLASAVHALRISLQLSFVQDYLSFAVLRLFGHRWPGEAPAEAGAEAPISSGLAPFLAGGDQPALLDLLRAALAVDLSDEAAAAQEREIERVLGKPLGRWLESDLFRFHLVRFGRRPVLWQLQSGRLSAARRPAFAGLLYFHRLDERTLADLREIHLDPIARRLDEALIAETQRQRSPGAARRRAEIAALRSELVDFITRLDALALRGFDTPELSPLLAGEQLDRWTSLDGQAPAPCTHEELAAQERRYLPEREDGVRANLAPLQRAGLLAAEVLAPKDAVEAVADRARFRAHERRLCREAKLDRPAWWSSPHHEG